MKRMLALFATALLVGLSGAFAQEIDVRAQNLTTGTIAEYIAANAGPAEATADPLCYEAADVPGEEFNCLAQALQVTGLTETLSSSATYTVFAPTDAAFAELAEDLGADYQALFTDTTALTEVLRNHVIEGDTTTDSLWSSADPTSGDVTVTTLAGNELTLNFADRIEGDVTTTAEFGTAGDPNITGRTVRLDNGSVIPVGYPLLPSGMGM